MSRDFKTFTDEALAAHLATGIDDAACDELFSRYRQKVYLWCYSYTHDVDEAVDCTQEIFIRIFRSIGGFRGGSLLGTWIYRVARNYCLSEMANRGRQWRERLKTIDDLEIADTNTTDALEETEIQGQLDNLMATGARHMKADELTAFVLHYRDGLTVREITRALNCSNATGARTLIQNARRKFRRLIDGKGKAHG